MGVFRSPVPVRLLHHTRNELPRTDAPRKEFERGFAARSLILLMGIPLALPNAILPGHKGSGDFWTGRAKELPYRQGNRPNRL